ncbi:MAG: hypothetical protein U9N42_08565 [Campylobacterota bacterium]|nr:hypothetical protein [Campylobacterota bacterium]
MKHFIVICLLAVSLFAEYPVAKFGWIGGEVYILRHGKLIEAYDGYNIDEYDTIYSKSYSKAKIIFNNGLTYDLVGKKSVNMQEIMKQNKMTRVKTTKQIEAQRVQKEQQEPNNNYNSKFYKQRFKVEQDRLERLKEEEQREKTTNDIRKNIYIDHVSKNIHNDSSSDESTISIGNVYVEPRSKVKDITVRGRSNDVSNYSTGKNSHSNVEVGNVHVK